MKNLLIIFQIRCHGPMLRFQCQHMFPMVYCVCGWGQGTRCGPKIFRGLPVQAVSLSIERSRLYALWTSIQLLAYIQCKFDKMLLNHAYSNV